jgi:hypothetical protein
MTSIEEMLHQVEDGPVREKLLSIYEAYEDDLVTLSGSVRYHHVYIGGLHDHIQQTMYIATRLYKTLKQMGPLDCSLDDVTLVSFISGLNCIDRITMEMKETIPYFSAKGDLVISPTMQIMRIIGKHGLVLEDRHVHALTFMSKDWKEEEMEFLGDMVNVAPLAAILRAAKNLSINCFPLETSLSEEKL